MGKGQLTIYPSQELLERIKAAAEIEKRSQNFIVLRELERVFLVEEVASGR